MPKASTMSRAHRRSLAMSLSQDSLIAAIVAIFSFGGMTACRTSCSVERDKNWKVVETGITDLENGTYESAPPNGKWLEFPPFSRFEFRHGLGGTPKEVVPYVSFHEEPLPEDGVGNAALPAGNIVIFAGWTSEYIRVQNDTCETFYLRIYAADPAPAGGAAGNGSDGGAGGTGS